MGYYIYDGPVINNFGKIINNKWKGETYAVSYNKAISNLCYQFKKQYGLIKNTKVTLSETLIED